MDELSEYNAELSAKAKDRAREMNKYWKSGYGYSAIAEEFGISRQRVYQILNKYWQEIAVDEASTELFVNGGQDDHVQRDNTKRA